jgi:superfamily II DNA/RNA helicase
MTPSVCLRRPIFGQGKYLYVGVVLIVTFSLFVGGTEVSANVELLKKGCQLAVGTCGRIVQLIKLKVLQLSKVQLLVLDEADELMDDDFVKQIK